MSSSSRCRRSRPGAPAPGWAGRAVRPLGPLGSLGFALLPRFPRPLPLALRVVFALTLPNFLQGGTRWVLITTEISVSRLPEVANDFLRLTIPAGVVASCRLYLVRISRSHAGSATGCCLMLARG